MDSEVIIIGAGPAGSTAAILLARAGRRVLVLEKSAFPRAKVCGGCLSGAGVTFLERLFGTQQAWQGTVAQEISFIFGSYRLRTNPRGRTRIVIRSEFDDFLIREAIKEGARVEFNSSAQIVRGENGYDVMVGRRRLTAPMILVASGLGGTARFDEIRPPSNHGMVAQQWMQPGSGDLPAVGCIEMHWLRGGYVGLATPREDCTIVALAAEVAPGDRGSAWQRLRDLNPGATLWNVLEQDAPQRYEARGAAGFPWAPRRLGIENVLLIGDSAGYREPFSGEGMAQAMRSAHSATTAILQGSDVQSHYARLMRRRHAPAIARLQWIGGALRAGWTQRLANGPVLVPQALLARVVEWVHVRASA